MCEMLHDYFIIKHDNFVISNFNEVDILEMLGAQRPLCSQIALGKAGTLTTQHCLLKEKIYNLSWDWRRQI